MEITSTPTVNLNISADLTIKADPKLFDAFAAIAQAIQRQERGAPPVTTPAAPAMQTRADEPTAPASPAAPILDDILREAKAKAEAGFRTQIFTLVTKYGAKNISGIPSESLGAFIADVRALGAPA